MCELIKMSAWLFDLMVGLCIIVGIVTVIKFILLNCKISKDIAVMDECIQDLKDRVK